jgi:hypothetical protein
MRPLMNGRVSSLVRLVGRPRDRSTWYREIPLATAINVHSAKLTAHISPGCLPACVWRGPCSAPPIAAFRRGRRMSSPPQFGQVPCVFAAHAGQKVHSYEQIYASPSAATAPPHFSHCAFISRCIAGCWMRWTLMISRWLCQFWQNTPIADQEQNAEPGAASGRIRGGKLRLDFPRRYYIIPWHLGKTCLYVRSVD